MLKIYFKTLKSKRFSQIKQIRSGAWLHFDQVSPDDIDQAAKLLHLGIEEIRDSLDLFEVPRIERINGTLLLFARLPYEEKTANLYTVPLTIILSKKYFVTIAPVHCELVENIGQNKLAPATTQQSKLLLQILNIVAREFMSKIKQVNDRVNKQKKGLENISNADITFLINSEEILNQYLAALQPMEAMFEVMLSGNYLRQYEGDKDLFEDVLIGLKQSTNLCRSNAKTLVSLRNSYQIIFTNNLNRTIKFLTSFTILLTIPTVIGSLYGMNVALPLGNHPMAFIFIMLITFGLSMLFLGLLFWKKWL
ncbi:magnesium transporter CorA family protein [Candidatus Beckwithbacteria bacterium]|nr:magnesium transporter CorA family protein [Candidatus Beckwithbacteria bacterium]